MRTSRALVVLPLLALAAACGGSSAPAASGGATTSSPAVDDTASGSTIRIKGFDYNEITVKAGQKVTVINGDDAPHTVTDEKGAFDVSVADKETSSFTAPDEPGTYVFFCKVHASMKHRKLVVE